MTDDIKHCTECGGLIAYGDRHHNCGTVAMNYQKRISTLESENAALRDHVAGLEAKLKVAKSALKRYAYGHVGPSAADAALAKIKELS